MSATLVVLLLTLIFALTLYLKNLQKENLKFNTLFCHSETPTLFINAKGVIHDLNLSAQNLLGYSKTQLSKQKWYEKLIPDERSLQVRHLVHQALKKDEKSTFTAPVICADGTVLEIDFTLSRLPEPLKGSILTLVDKSKGEALKEELMSVQEHLKESKKALEHLSEQFKVTFNIAINGIALLDGRRLLGVGTRVVDRRHHRAVNGIGRLARVDRAGLEAAVVEAGGSVLDYNVAPRGLELLISRALAAAPCAGEGLLRPFGKRPLW